MIGDDPQDHHHDVDTSNLAGGEPIRYINDEEGVTVTGPAGQVIVANAADVTVEGVDLTGTSVGLWAAFADDLTVRNTTAADNRVGVVLYESDRASLANNTVSQNSQGLLIGDSSQARLTDQIVVENERGGIHLQEAPGTQVSGSTIADNGYEGLSITDTTGTVDARDNWWGAASGPSGDVEDACTGTPADGAGAEILVRNASVCFAPWLTEPNPDAGVG